MPEPITETSVLRMLRNHCLGCARAKSGRFITWQLGYRKRHPYRQLQQAIQDLKNKGHLIVWINDGPTSSQGYCIAQTVETWNRYSRSYLSRAKSIYKTARIQEKSASAQFGAPDGPSKQLELGLS